MIVNNEKVSLRQIKILLLLDAFSLGSLTMSRRAIEFANSDAWMVILLAGFIGLIYAYLVVKLCNKFPGKSIIGITEEVFNKPIAKIFGLFLVVRFIIMMSLEIRIFGEIIKNIILPRTPIEVIIVSVLVLLAYIVTKGYEYRAKLAEILIYIVFIPIIIIFMFAAKDVDVSNLMPVLTTNPSKLLLGAYVLSNIFKMIEILFFSNLFINTNKSFFKTVFKATMVSTIFNVIMTVLVITSLTPKEALHHVWPIVTMANSINFPGLLIERQELLFIIFLINSIFIMISGEAIVTNILVKAVFNLKKTPYWFSGIFVIVYFISLIPDNIAQLYDILEIITLYTPVIFMFVIPIIYLIIAKIRKKGIISD